MIYYLAGPIDTAGKKLENVEAFKEAANSLRNLGYDVRSPIEFGTEGQTYDYFIRRDIKMLLDCGAIILLPGWPQSKGARNELAIAMMLNLKVYYYIANTVRLVDMNF